MAAPVDAYIFVEMIAETFSTVFVEHLIVEQFTERVRAADTKGCGVVWWQKTRLTCARETAPIVAIYSAVDATHAHTKMHATSSTNSTNSTNKTVEVCAPFFPEAPNRLRRSTCLLTP